ncbi:MAG: 4Fe-4S double cluster binding domain-containing protein [Bacteroidales bacterium]|jgi:epoxyqueuosine reductase QueG
MTDPVMEMIRDIITKHLIPDKEFIFGFSELQGLTKRKFDGFNYGISIGMKLDDRIIDKIIDGPTIEYHEHYKQVNKELAGLTMTIQEDLSEAGIKSITIPPTNTSSDGSNKHYLETLTMDVSHKMVATRAGLGWIGKSDLFISDRFGPRLRLVSILLKQDPGICAVPVNESKCGKCNICVEKCPAKAASGELWNIHTHRDEFFDAQKCRSKCAELSKQRLGRNVHICGICVSVCPFGKNRQKS